MPQMLALFFSQMSTPTLFKRVRPSYGKRLFGSTPLERLGAPVMNVYLRASLVCAAFDLSDSDALANRLLGTNISETRHCEGF